MSDALLELGELENWLEHLSECKPLGEEQVKKLCDKVLGIVHRLLLKVSI